jgi:hypothetical protein
MSFKITRSGSPVADTVAVFGGVLGLAAIGIQLYKAINPLTGSAAQTLPYTVMLVASVVTVIYSLVALRNRQTMSWIDRGLYFLIPLVFSAFAGFLAYVLKALGLFR